MTYSPAPTAYVTGQKYRFITNFSNTGAATVAVNGLAALPLKKFGGTGLASGDLGSGVVVECVYDGTNCQLTSFSGSTTGSGAFVLATSPTINGKSIANPIITSINVQKFSSSGTYTPSTGMVYVTFECWGGGGGGQGISGGTNVAAGAAGGGSGGYSRKTATASTVGASQTVTIGAAGSAGSAGGGVGGAGGTTSVGSLCIANGGSGANATGGAGGTAGTGDITATGAPGMTSFSYLSGSGYGAMSGMGGSTLVGGGGGSVSCGTVITTAGINGTGYGSGGSGACTDNNSGGSQAGGAGTAGYVVATEYVSN